MRIPITLLAGILRFPYPLFAAGVAVSTAIWAGFFLTVGIRLGPAAESLTHPHGLTWVVIAVGFAGHGIDGALVAPPREARAVEFGSRRLG